MRATAVRRSGPPVPCCPPPFASVVRGVGIKCATSDRVELPVFVVGFGAVRFAVAFREFRESRTGGVGRGVTVVGSCPRWSPPLQSRPAGARRLGGGETASEV